MPRKKATEVAVTQNVAEKVEVRQVNNIYTYVGAGEDSPRVINFMGVQKFVRGEGVELTNPHVIAKVANNPAFVNGEVDENQLHDYDNQAQQLANSQRVRDKAVDVAYKKRFGGE